MSTLEFDGQTHEIRLVGADGTVIGTWTAYNNVDSHASLRALDDGTYSMQDTTAPHSHPADANGPYGSYGIFRFDYPGHAGIGVHSGRANARRNPGPQHATMGCIRTTDDAMSQIQTTAATDPLTTIQVSNNSAADAAVGEARHGARGAAGNAQ